MTAKPGGFGLAALRLKSFNLRPVPRGDIAGSEHFRLLMVISSDAMLSLGNHLYSLDSGSVVILPPAAEASLVYGTHFEYTELTFSAAPDDPLRLSAQLNQLALGLSHIRPGSAKTEAFHATLIRLNELIAQGRSTGRAAYARVFDLVADLLTESRRNVGSASLDIKSSTRLARDIKAYLDLHFTEDITLKGLAARFYVSPSHLSRVFEEEIGRPAFTYINDLRIERAAALLKAGQRAGIVADACGYHTDQHFIQEFRARMGTTPGRFRLSFMNRKAQ